MSANPLVTNIIAAFLLAAIILYRYGDWYRHHIIVTIAVLVAWCFSFLIIFILPLDVSSVSNANNSMHTLYGFQRTALSMILFVLKDVVYDLNLNTLNA